MRTMPRKGRRRSAAQIRQTGAMRKRRWDSPEETEMVDEMHRCMTFEEYRKRMTKAEQEAEKSRKDLKNAEKRLTRMAEKMKAAEHDTKGLEHELDQAKKRLETATAKCARWKERTVELRGAVRRIKAREYRGPSGISSAVESAITALASSGRPLPHSSRRIEGRVHELVNELAFTWRVPTSMIAGIIDTVSRATVDVCYGGHVDDVDVDMGEHYELDEHEHEHGAGPVTDAAVGGLSSTVVPSPEEPSRGENA